MGAEGKDYYYGHGMLDVYGALLNKQLANPYVFAASSDDQNLYIKSDLFRANDDGSFQLDNVLAEDVYVYGWRDVNKNNRIDTGDYFGKYENLISAENNNSYTASLELYYLGESFNNGLSVQGMAEIENN